MTVPLATYRDAIKTWVEAQSGCTAQWRDDTGGWQTKPRIRMHLHDSAGRGIDWIDWAQDAELTATPPYTEENPFVPDFVPTAKGLRVLTLTLIAETRDQDTTAMHYLEKLRTSIKKPSVRMALYSAGLVIESCENVLDLESLVDDRIESKAHLDVHLACVVNDRDESEADSYVETFTIDGSLTTPADADAGPGEEEIP
jgi:hypothetical protein